MATIIPFNPSPNSNFQFQCTLDGAAYNVICTYSAYAQRYYVNIYDLTGNLVMSRPLIASPSFYNASLTLGFFDTTMIYRESSGCFEIPGLPAVPLARPPAPPYVPPPTPPRIPHRYWRLTISRANGPEGIIPPAHGGTTVSSLVFIENGVSYPKVPMTSDTTPAPLVASSNTFLSSAFLPYKAFSGGITPGVQWQSADAASDLIAGYLSIDFGIRNPIAPTSVRIAVDDGMGVYYPVDFQIDASDTGVFAGEKINYLSVVNHGNWPAYTYLTFPLVQP